MFLLDHWNFKFGIDWLTTSSCAEIVQGLELLHKLVEKLADSNARVRKDAASALMSMGATKTIGPAYIATKILRKPKKERATAYRPILGRLQVSSSCLR